MSIIGTVVLISCYLGAVAKIPKRKSPWIPHSPLDNISDFDGKTTRGINKFLGFFHIDFEAGTEVRNLCGEANDLIPALSFADRTGSPDGGEPRLSFYFTAGHGNITSAGRKSLTVLPDLFGWSGSHASAGRNRRCSTTILERADRRSSVPGTLQAERETISSAGRNEFRGRSENERERERVQGAGNRGRDPFRSPVREWVMSNAQGVKQQRTVTAGRRLIAAAGVAAVLAAGTAVVDRADATTISTNYAEVYVDNLKPGASYNLSEVADFPMWVGYRGDAPVELSVESVMPMESELKKDYEPIPDPSWISVSQSGLSLLPDENANIDVTITIPNDEKYLGKKYQGYLKVSSVPQKGQENGVAVALALKGRVLFSIAAKPATEEEMRELKKKKARASQGVIITPERFAVELAGGLSKAVVTEDVPLKIINSSREKVAITIEAVEPDASGVSLPRGYAKGNREDVVFSRKKLSVKPDGIENVEIQLNSKGTEVEKSFYVTRVSIKSSTLDVVKFVKIYADRTAK